MNTYSHIPDNDNPDVPDDVQEHRHVAMSIFMVARRYLARLHRLFTRAASQWKGLLDRMQRAPLAYKLSFTITLLVVSCMVLLGSLLIQQQSQQLQQQISEQGTTLAHLMAKAAREPLLAEDKLALDAISSSFANSSSVLGAAIVSL
jgi:hypothetical protein